MSSINIEKAIEFMYWLKDVKRPEYNMNYCRDGVSCNTADCSGAVSRALIKAGCSDPGILPNTDMMHNWIVNNGFKLIAQNSTWTAKKGDVIIWGKKGASGGAYGHTGMFVSNTHIIHCNWGSNGVTVDAESSNAIWPLYKSYPWYVYRYEGKSVVKPPVKLVERDPELIKGDVDVKSKDTFVIACNKEYLNSIDDLIIAGQSITAYKNIVVLQNKKSDVGPYKNVPYRIAVVKNAKEISSYCNYAIVGKDAAEIEKLCKEFKDGSRRKFDVKNYR